MNYFLRLVTVAKSSKFRKKIICIVGNFVLYFTAIICCYRAFLSSRVQDLRSIVHYEQDKILPIVNLKVSGYIIRFTFSRYT